MSYLNPREQPTYPQDVIQRITSSNPNNDSSPFWDEHSKKFYLMYFIMIFRMETIIAEGLENQITNECIWF